MSIEDGINTILLQMDVLQDDNDRLKAINAELLEALERLMSELVTGQMFTPGNVSTGSVDKARSAIAKAHGHD